MVVNANDLGIKISPKLKKAAEDLIDSQLQEEAHVLDRQDHGEIVVDLCPLVNELVKPTMELYDRWELMDVLQNELVRMYSTDENGQPNFYVCKGDGILVFRKPRTA